MSLVIKKAGSATAPSASKPNDEDVIVGKPVTKAEKSAAVSAAMKQLNKDFATLVIQKFKSKGTRLPSLPLRMPTVDEIVLSCGGIPRGRIIEIFGEESAGKTTVALDIIGEAQKLGEICAFVDAEHALDPSYAQKLGVNIDELLISQPDYGEQAIEVVLALARTGGVGVIVVDSVSALIPKAELEGDMGDSHMGLQARMMSQTMRKLAGAAGKTGTIIIFINQVRDKIGVMFGDPSTTTGGKALKFYSSVRFKIMRVSKSDGGEIKNEAGIHIGHKVRFKNVKNKVGPPFRETIVDLLYGSGFDKRGDLIEYAVQTGVVEKAAGGWYIYNKERHRKNSLTESPIFETINGEAYAARDARLKVEADAAKAELEAM